MANSPIINFDFSSFVKIKINEKEYMSYMYIISKSSLLTELFAQYPGQYLELEINKGGDYHLLFKNEEEFHKGFNTFIAFMSSLNSNYILDRMTCMKDLLQVVFLSDYFGIDQKELKEIIKTYMGNNDSEVILTQILEGEYVSSLDYVCKYLKKYKKNYGKLDDELISKIKSSAKFPTNFRVNLLSHLIRKNMASIRFVIGISGAYGFDESKYPYGDEIVDHLCVWAKKIKEGFISDIVRAYNIYGNKIDGKSIVINFNYDAYPYITEIKIDGRQLELIFDGFSAYDGLLGCVITKTITKDIAKILLEII